MYVDFNDLPISSRIWIYQFDRKISSEEKDTIENVLRQFCEQWQAHGAPLKTSFQIKFNHFLILVVDENVASASGCSIDGSVRVLKELGSKLNLDFFDRTQAAFLINNSIQLFPLVKLKELFNSEALKPAMITFNNLVASKGDFQASWEVPVNQSWLARYLPKSTLA
ncbi:MAG: hypothetical protein RIA63_09775 [Cyclobacteriaceae bacterium]